MEKGPEAEENELIIRISLKSKSEFKNNFIIEIV